MEEARSVTSVCQCMTFMRRNGSLSSCAFAVACDAVFLPHVFPLSSASCEGFAMSPGSQPGCTGSRVLHTRSCKNLEQTLSSQSTQLAEELQTVHGQQSENESSKFWFCLPLNRKPPTGQLCLHNNLVVACLTAAEPRADRRQGWHAWNGSICMTPAGCSREA